MREAVSHVSVARRRRGFWSAFWPLAISVFLVTQLGDALAQQSGADQGSQNLTPDEMRQMFTGQGLNNNNQGQAGSLQPQFTILEPTAPTDTYLPDSRLEQIMSARAGIKLKQFGYEQLGVGRAVNLPQVGGVQDDYVLGSGDEIVVTLRGQDNSEHRVMVDRDGNVVLPRISPIAAAGLRFGDFRAELLASIHNAYMATDAYVSIGRLRQISVMVAGEVGSPGVRILTGLSTPIDAILVSGGVRKTGSLRDVKLIHQGKTTTIDLYAFLTSGAALNRTALGDGDRIVVPPLTKVVAATGWLRRPGIYEIPAGQSAISVRTLVDLAGGLEVRGQYKLTILHIKNDGQTQLAPVTAESNLVRDGEILLAQPGADEIVDRATLAGGTSLAGSYSVKDGTHLSEILKAPGALGTSPYMLFGIISRRDPRTYIRSLIAFSPIAAISGDFDPPLASGDVVRVFSMREGRLLSDSVTRFAAHKQYQEELARNPTAAQTNASGDEEQGGSDQGGGAGADNSGNQQGAGNSGANTSMTQYSSSANASGARAASAAASIGGQSSQSYNDQQYSAPAPNNQNVGTPYPGGPGASGNNPQGSPAPGAANFGFANGAAGQYPQPQPNQMASLEQPPTANFEVQIASPGAVPLNTEVTNVRDLATQLDVDTTVLLNFLTDHEVTLDGAVRGPGSYVVGPAVNLHDLVMVAGGTVRWADRSGVELISTDVDEAAGSATTVKKSLPLSETTLANYIIQAHDELRFREVFTNIGLGSITLEGEVRFPGQYKIIRGEHLTDLLKRAGGLTDVAYPYGTVYLRKSVAAMEEESFRRTADQVENQLLAGMTRTNASSKLDPGAFTSAQSFVQMLRTQKGLGRISVIADPTVLAVRPNEDPLLESGDVVYIPQRPSTVSVLGEVLQPGSFPYNTHLGANEYLARAGGYSAFADDSLTYVILPDGSAEKLDKSWLPFGSQNLPAGSTIVVPRDIAPFSWNDFTVNATQIFSQLAIAGASLAVISGH